MPHFISIFLKRYNMNSLNFGRLLNDMRFWVFLFFVIRLYGITQPPLEIAHNWRQTTVTMVARNFYETDNNIFHPRIDIGGQLSGITGMEFPVFNYLIYLLSLLFGYDHWYGRLINLFVSSIGIIAFYDIIRRLRNHKLAFYAGLILLSSLWFTYSRKIMPDTFSVALVVIGMQQAVIYLLKGTNHWRLALFFLLTAFGLLSKLPAIATMALLPFLLLNKEYALRLRIRIAVLSVFALFPACCWYFFYIPYLNETFHLVHFFMGKPMLVAGQEITSQWQAAFAQFYETALRYSGFVVFSGGLIIALRKDKRLALYALVSLLMFLILILKAGDNFVRHSYYMIPFIPVMAVLAAFTLVNIQSKKLAVGLLALIMLEGVLNQQHDFRLKEKDLPLLNLEAVLADFSATDELVAINSGEYPTPMYFAHRKGWVSSNQMLSDTTYINELSYNGLKTIIILKRSFGTDLLLPYAEVYNDADFRIYKP